MAEKPTNDSLNQQTLNQNTISKEFEKALITTRNKIEEIEKNPIPFVLKTGSLLLFFGSILYGTCLILAGVAVIATENPSPSQGNIWGFFLGLLIFLLVMALLTFISFLRPMIGGILCLIIGLCYFVFFQFFVVPGGVPGWYTPPPNPLYNLYFLVPI